ncbi:hypothetical protein ACFO25_03590 [Paenactinomyces guangxiensis]|uniref:Uncharacterized protein n=1 Tax=Paenactinomyces guangxiensis TaxID=1490290 RepID=A0A7W1WRX8_9BACL|nr:hypothetical protein [Paenactinomyces guangxiensis]MBA4494848.1 hypothetical protein [Paenactinomyces guangxiensis]MBH8591931.1 hypothetical protein [Paenactinomyces guangxiensis]
MLGADDIPVIAGADKTFTGKKAGEKAAGSASAWTSTVSALFRIFYNESCHEAGSD